MLKLIKTLGGSDGSPEKCNTCGNHHFQKSGVAWHCTTCGRYSPTELGFNSIKEHIQQMHEIQKELAEVRKSLEDSVS